MREWQILKVSREDSIYINTSAQRENQIEGTEYKNLLDKINLIKNIFSLIKNIKTTNWNQILKQKVYLRKIEINNTQKNSSKVMEFKGKKPYVQAKRLSYL